mmetsp:Transcript_2135/g.6699  ORF Transcript_2135/g.6699 Transcript_2135/m.6699 type:complete len:231 (+) Transcript_2135:515-1207(+)
MPGDTVLMRIFCLASGATRPIVSEFKAPLLAAYKSGAPIYAEPEEICTIAPPMPPCTVLILFSASLIAIKGPATFVRMSSKRSSAPCSVQSDKLLVCLPITPALFTRTVSGVSTPKAESANEKSFTTSSSTPMSQRTAQALPPASPIRRHTRSAELSSERYAMTTPYPLAASASEQAAPIPRPPPVTIATPRGGALDGLASALPCSPSVARVPTATIERRSNFLKVISRK